MPNKPLSLLPFSHRSGTTLQAASCTVLSHNYKACVPDMARCYGLGLACFTLLAAAASATQFRVGGQRGWSVPDANVEPYDTWAGRMRLQIGDQLLFVYPKEKDSVLLVEPSAYNACNTTSYVKKFDDGSTVFTFDRSGPYFFISGNEANCRANEKLTVVVLANRGGRTPPPVAPAPSSMPPSTSAPMPSPLPPPSAAPMPAPAVTPSSAPPPTAPAPTTTPSSPPSPAALAPSPSSSPATPGSVPQPPSASANAPGAEGANSTTPTTPTAKDQSGAAPVVAGFVTSLGAYVGYAMLAI